MIVFSIAHGDGIVMRDAYLRKGGEQACSLIDAGGQDHNRALVVDNLEFQSEVANNGKNFGVLGLPRINNDQTTRKWRHATPLQGVNECLWRRLGEQFRF